MSCSGFEKFNLGDWTREQFEQHAAHCDVCRHAAQEDKRLLELSRGLKTEVVAPHLWARIEHELRAATPRKRAADNYRWAFRIAVVLLIAVGVGFGVKFWSASNSALLADSALSRVEAQERDYEAAINELEEIVSPQLAAFDQELMLLYRDRLETIDTQIEHCKEALSMNPANAHIRRYLLAALKDKKETLKEIKEIANA